MELLERLVKNSPVSPAMNAFLLKTMADSQTGLGQLRAGLPPGMTLAHKTGHSGTHGGVTAATNHIGLVTLPDGRKLAIAVFVTDSRADETTRHHSINLNPIGRILSPHGRGGSRVQNEPQPRRGSACSESLVSDGFDRIETGGAPGREPAGKDANRSQGKGHGKNDRRIGA